MVVLMNLTKHDIRLVIGPDNIITVPSSGHVARTTGDNQELVGSIVYEECEVPVYKWTESDIKELPEPKDGVIYLTSGVVAQMVNRHDVMSPNTSPHSIVRDVYGNKIGVKSLITYTE